MTTAELYERLASLGPIVLAAKPTPIQFLDRLTSHLGGPRIYIKRDDLTGLAFGGNKTRQLEYVFAHVLTCGADSVVAGAYTQSNWCRQINAAANKLGLETRLVLARGRKGELLQGNFLLFNLLGAKIKVVDADDEGLEPFLDEEVAAMKREGRRPYKISSFDLDTQSRAALGYVEAAAEIHDQETKLNASFDRLYIAGSEMSPAGLALGAKVLELPWQVVGIAPVHYRIKADRASDIAEICNAAAMRIGIDVRLDPSSIVNDAGYVGPGYGVVSKSGQEAFELLARTEGILLDPVYTSKGFAGLIDHIARGLIDRSESILFVHTGGLPAIFAYSDELREGPGAVAAHR